MSQLLNPDHTISEILGPPPGEIPVLELSKEEKEMCMVYNFGGSFGNNEEILSGNIILIYKKGVVIGCFAKVISLIKDSKIGKITAGVYNNSEIDQFLETMKKIVDSEGQFIEITGKNIDFEKIKISEKMLKDHDIIRIIETVITNNSEKSDTDPANFN